MSQILTASAADIRALVPMGDAIEAVRGAVIALAAGEFEMPTRTALRDGQFLVMPAHHRPSGTAMIKTLSLNFGGRQPAILGSVTWSDLDGTDQVVADAAAVTMLRTGAITGVATDLLAPAGASTCTIVGAGGQAADQVRAVHTVRPLTELTVVGRNPTRAEALASLLAGELTGVEVTATSRVNESVEGRDIVCCATTATEPLFLAEVIAPHAHVNAIGAFRPTMKELPSKLLADSVVVIDELEAILEESGEIIEALAMGAISQDSLIEIGHALTSGLERGTGRTVFKTVGVAVQDWAIAKLLAERLVA